MRHHSAIEVIETLPKSRTRFFYHKDRYALELLARFVGTGSAVAEAKQSRFAKLLDKPVVREAMSDAGDGILTAENLTAWRFEPECYVLTLASWGRDSKRRDSYYQTSRAGVNLVLQLNFSMKHDRRYLAMLRPDADAPFQHWGHPNSRKGRQTLAWARLDFDLDGRDALIEEVQSDWIKLAQSFRQFVVRCPEAEFGGEDMPFQCSRAELIRYIDDVMAVHAKMWDEAMLWAAIWFLRDEIGLRRVFYHTHRTGAVLKTCMPPRSLYTELPKRFCFNETQESPLFLEQDSWRRLRAIRKRSETRFHLLEL